MQPKLISAAQPSTVPAKKSKTTTLEELPFHRKLGFSPLTFCALCFSFLILLWYILFTPQLR
jgi:ABC-type uncharacterized transport system permease subunit